MKYIMFDVDGVLTKTLYDGDSPKLFIDVMIARKNLKIPFPTALNRVFGNDKQAKEDLINNWFKNNVLNKSIIRVIKQFESEGYQLGIATNNCPEIVNAFIRRNKLDGYFPLINRFFPENLGWVWKPHSRYYTTLMKLFQCMMGDLALVDDNYENIQAIKNLGGTGMWYDIKQRKLR